MDDVLIPKNFHFVWLGKPMPAHLVDNVYQWRRLHPAWSFYVWTERNIPELRNQQLYDSAESLVPVDALYQFRADLIRYELLYDHGGLYCDVDTRPLKPIDAELVGHREFAAMEDRNWVGNTYLGSVPGHPLLAEIIARILGNVQRHKGKRPNVLTGPKFLTPIWKRHGGYTARTEQFFPYSYSHVRNDSVPVKFGPEVVCVHQWFHTDSVMESRRARTR